MRRTTALLAVTVLALPGCRMNERMTGAIGGAAGGALIGAVAGASAGTVLLLAGLGAGAGYLIGDYMADQRCCSPCQPSPCDSPCAVPASTTTVTRKTAAASGSGTTWDARVAYEKGRSATTVEDARAAYQESARLDPTRPEPWNALALLSVATGDRTTARTHFTHALSLDPAYAPAKHNLDRLDQGF